MAHFAKVLDGIVVDIIAAEPEFFDTFVDETPGEWIQTSYNTFGGKHPEDRPLRKNFAGIGYTYNKDLDAFIAPCIYPSWTLNTETCLWEAPVEKPDDGELYDWNEENQSWDPVI